MKHSTLTANKILQSRHLRPSLEESIWRRVSWRVVPTFKRPGRTGYILDPEHDNASIKLKGVGAWNPAKIQYFDGVKNERHHDRAVRPREREYNAKTLQQHFGISDGGRFCMIAGGHTPYGAITVPKAKAEFFNAALLRANGVPAIIPLAVYEYSDLHYEGSALGCVCSKVESYYPYGLESIFFFPVYRYSGVREYAKKVAACLHDQSFELANKAERIALISKLYRQIGEISAQFALAGLFRHSGGINNYIFSFSQRSASFSDLDSSLTMEQIKPEVRLLQVCRDACSVLHKYFIRLVELVASGEFTGLETVLLKPPIQFLRGLVGYQNSSVFKHVVDTLSSLWEADYRSVYGTKKGEFRPRVYEVDLKLKREIFYCVAFKLLMPLLLDSRLGTRYYVKWSESAFRSAISGLDAATVAEVAGCLS